MFSKFRFREDTVFEWVVVPLFQRTPCIPAQLQSSNIFEKGDYERLEGWRVGLCVRLDWKLEDVVYL